tara:strand:+ start:541 stop:735 length:195 start_codon:yes stop_codon:yes gene_type:complete
MCQGFSGNKKDDNNQNLLDTYKDFGSQAVNMPGNINLIKKRKEHREKRINILSNGGDDIGPPNF